MTRIIGLITGNPAVMVWLMAAAFVAGAAGAWYVQGLRLDAVQAKYDGFVATTKAEGEAASKLAEAQVAEDKRKKESSDREYQISIDSLRTDVKRLRDARARGSFVPATPAGSGHPEVACFDRANLERTLQQFDAEVAGLIAEGDTDAIGLNVARGWANGR